MGRIDENELRALFAEIEAPPGLDRWRDRIADVHAEAYVREPDDDPEPAEDTDTDNSDTEDVEEKVDGTDIVALAAVSELRPKRQRRRSVAVAAAAAVVVGLAGIVVTTTLLSDAPPADPTMIIDGPDKTVSTPPSHDDPTDRVSAPPSSQQSSPGAGQPNQGGTQHNQPGDSGTMVGNPGGGGPEPGWPSMVGDPTATNTGVPLGATLGDHYGDLRITTAGQVVSDLRVTGTVIVDAPNVTLKRVLVVAPYGATAVRQNAGGLTVADSELSGGSSLTQGANGLTVRRSRLQSGVTIAGGAQLFDCFLDTADVLVTSGSSAVLLRHNTMDQVTMNDLDAPIHGVTVDDNLLDQVDLPTQAGSAGIHVLNNRFRGRAPSTGWNYGAADYQWSNNTYVDSGAPANP
jgi:hypothetical protein